MSGREVAGKGKRRRGYKLGRREGGGRRRERNKVRQGGGNRLRVEGGMGGGVKRTEGDGGKKKFLSTCRRGKTVALIFVAHSLEKRRSNRGNSTFLTRFSDRKEEKKLRRESKDGVSSEMLPKEKGGGSGSLYSNHFAKPREKERNYLKGDGGEKEKRGDWRSFCSFRGKRERTDENCDVILPRLPKEKGPV